MDERSQRIAQRFEIPMLVAALLVIPVLLIEQSHASHSVRAVGTALNWLIWLAFATELVTMLAIVPSRRTWLREHPLEVAIVVLTPPFLPASLQAARLLRLARVLRLVRIVVLGHRIFSMGGLRYAVLVVWIAALGGGAGFAAVEKGHGTWDGVYWAFSTMTTVGYGDISPHTTAGKILAVILMFIGIGFVALLTGAIAERFLAPGVEKAEREVFQEIEMGEADVLTELEEISQRLARLEQIFGARARPPTRGA